MQPPLEDKYSYQDLIEALELFGLTERFTYEKVRKAYKRLSKIHHPDNGGDSIKMVEINVALAMLESYMQNYHFVLDKAEYLRQNPYHHFMNQFHQDGVWNYRKDANSEE